MPTIEERVAYLEGTVGEHRRAFVELQHAIADVRSGVSDLRGDLNARFSQVDQRFEHVDRQLQELRASGTTQFTWMIGSQFAVLLSVIAALVGAYYR